MRVISQYFLNVKNFQNEIKQLQVRFYPVVVVAENAKKYVKEMKRWKNHMGAASKFLHKT